MDYEHKIRFPFASYSGGHTVLAPYERSMVKGRIVTFNFSSSVDTGEQFQYFVHLIAIGADRDGKILLIYEFLGWTGKAPSDSEQLGQLFCRRLNEEKQQSVVGHSEKTSTLSPEEFKELQSIYGLDHLLVEYQ